MKKSAWVVIGLIVVAVVVGVLWAHHHKAAKTTTSTTTPTSSTSPSQNQTAAVNNSVLSTKSNGSVGQYLTDPSGKTLYSYGQDTANKSNCTGSCLSTWPAYTTTGSTSGLPTNVGTITRSDNGKIQLTYKGMPLYFFASDSQGQVTGDGVNNFSVAKP